MVRDEEMLEELKKIRALLEPKPAPPPPKGLWAEFKSFIESYKVLGLAVAFIMGLYLGALVQSLVKDLLLPAIGLACRFGDLYDSGGDSDIRCRQLLGGVYNLRHRCLRDFHYSEDNKEVGHTIAARAFLKDQYEYIEIPMEEYEKLQQAICDMDTGFLSVDDFIDQVRNLLEKHAAWTKQK